MCIVQNFTTNLDTVVNYEEFLKLLEKVGYQGDFSSQDDAGPHLINAMREQIHQRISNMPSQDRDCLERLRKAARSSNQNDMANVFAKIAKKGSDKISQDELLIAMSRVSDLIQLGDIKELHRILVGAMPGSNVGIDDVKIPINEVV